MDSIKSRTAFGSKMSTDAVGGLSDGLVNICGTNEGSPAQNRVVTDEFHSDNHTACHEFHKTFKKWSSFMFSIKMLCNLI